MFRIGSEFLCVLQETAHNAANDARDLKRIREQMMR
jgi:hypothetical protein